jgi:hypothetical protein
MGSAIELTTLLRLHTVYFDISLHLLLTQHSAALSAVATEI